MCKYKIEYLKLENGKEPFFDWYNKLDKITKKRVAIRLMRLEEGNFGDYKQIDGELSELRFKFGAGYRIYYTQQNNTIVILVTAGDKSTQSKDIIKAKEYIKILKAKNYD